MGRWSRGRGPALVVSAGAATAVAIWACGHAPEPEVRRAPLPPLPGRADAGLVPLGPDAPTAAVEMRFAPTPWGRGDRMRADVWLDTTPPDGDGKTVSTRSIEAIVIGAVEPAQLTLMLDKLVPDPGALAGTSCVAQVDAGGPHTPRNDLVCTLARTRLVALRDLVSPAPGDKRVGDRADGLARIPFDLLDLTPAHATATLASFPDTSRAEFAISVDGADTKLTGRVVVDRNLTTARGHVEGTRAGASVQLHFDLGPAD